MTELLLLLLKHRVNRHKNMFYSNRPLLPPWPAPRLGSRLPPAAPPSVRARAPQFEELSAGCPQSPWKSLGLSFLCTVLSIKRDLKTKTGLRRWRLSASLWGMATKTTSPSPFGRYRRRAAWDIPAPRYQSTPRSAEYSPPESRRKNTNQNANRLVCKHYSSVLSDILSFYKEQANIWYLCVIK